MSEAQKPKKKLQFKKGMEFHQNDNKSFVVSPEDLKNNSAVPDLKETLMNSVKDIVPSVEEKTVDISKKEDEEKTNLTQISDENPVEEKKLKKKLVSKSNSFKPQEPVTKTAQPNGSVPDPLSTGIKHVINNQATLFQSSYPTPTTGYNMPPFSYNSYVAPPYMYQPVTRPIAPITPPVYYPSVYPGQIPIQPGFVPNNNFVKQPHPGHQSESKKKLNLPKNIHNDKPAETTTETKQETQPQAETLVKHDPITPAKEKKEEAPIKVPEVKPVVETKPKTETAPVPAPQTKTVEPAKVEKVQEKVEPAPKKEEPVAKKEEPAIQKKEEPVKPQASSDHPFRVTENEIQDFIDSFDGELPENMTILIRNTREVQNNNNKSKYGGKDNRDNRGKRGHHNNHPGSSSKIEFKKPANDQGLSRNQEKPQEKIDSSTNLPQLQRSNFTDERLKQIKAMKETSDIWLSTKIDDDDKIKQQRNLKQLLNKITADNFEVISDTILENCKIQFLADTAIEFMVMKAWREPRYTKTYAQLVVKLVTFKFEWDKNSKKDYIKKKVLNRVEEEYVDGFQKYYEFSKEIYTDPKYNPQERFELLNKKKFNLIGNINFICELFSQNILSFFILKIIVLYGIGNFIKEYIRTEKEEDKFSIKEDYLEALLKIFENLGKLIEKKDSVTKTKMERKNAVDDDILDDVEHMMEHLVDNTDRFLDKSKLDQKGKSIYSLTSVFFGFIEIINKKKIGARMESLIENLKQFKESGWLVEIRKVSAAKTLSEVKKEIEMEREEQEGNKYDYEEDYYDNYDRHTGESYRKRGKDNYGGKDSKKQYKGGSKNTSSSQYIPKESTPKVKKYEDLKKDAAFYLKENRSNLIADDYKNIFLKNETSSVKNLLRAYLETFTVKIPKEIAKNWIDLPEIMFEKNIAREIDLVEALHASNKVFFLEYADTPYLLEFIAKILLSLWKKQWISLSKFDFSDQRDDIVNEDEQEEYHYYIMDMREKIKKVFTESGDYEQAKKELNF